MNSTDSDSAPGHASTAAALAAWATALAPEEADLELARRALVDTVAVRSLPAGEGAA